jgi:hypothetical protein
MRYSNSRALKQLVTGSAASILGVLSVVACDGGSGPPTASAKPRANATTASRAMTGQELAWLQAFTKLQTKMQKDLTGRNSEVLTSSRMRSYAKMLRGCGPELARLGLPGERLESVHTMAAKACGQADKGARCFSDAAKIGTPIVGTAAERKSTKAINCGLNALGDTTNLLADAVVKGEEIKAQAGQS